MPEDFSVKPGDCFNSIAKEKGYYNYLTLYNHGDNATLKGKRPNPNCLVEDDVVKIPDKRQKKVALDLDKEKKFVVDRQKTKLRVALVDVENKALVVAKCKLAAGGKSTMDKPGAKGLIELLDIDPQAKSGTFEYSLEKPPKPPKAVKSPKTKPPEKPPHPPDIVPADFIDEIPKADKTALEMKMDLSIGFLEHHTEIRGALQRLNNLGCKAPDATAKTADDDDTKRMVKAYQKFKKPDVKDPSGAIADLQTDLETDHDKI